MVVASSAARTATPVMSPLYFNNADNNSLTLVIDVTAVTATPSTVFSIVGWDSTTQKSWLILASAAVVGTGTVVLRVHPEGTAAANLVARDVLPTQWGVTAVHGNANSMTYSIGAQVMNS
jgi:hypothetical protein